MNVGRICGPSSVTCPSASKRVAAVAVSTPPGVCVDSGLGSCRLKLSLIHRIRAGVRQFRNERHVPADGIDQLAKDPAEASGRRRVLELNPLEIAAHRDVLLAIANLAELRRVRVRLGADIGEFAGFDEDLAFGRGRAGWGCAGRTGFARGCGCRQVNLLRRRGRGLRDLLSQ